MKRLNGSVTSRGQVTLPVEVRKRLGIDAPGRIVFEIEDDAVRISAGKATVDSVFGILPPLRDGMTLEEAIELAKDEHAWDVTREGV